MQKNYTKDQMEDMFITVAIYVAALIWSQFLLHRFVLQNTYIGENILSDSRVIALFMFLQMPAFIAYLWNDGLKPAPAEAVAAAGLPCMLLVLPGIWKRQRYLILLMAALYLIGSLVFWIITVKKEHASGRTIWLLGIKANFYAVFVSLIFVLLCVIWFGRINRVIEEKSSSDIEISREDYIGQYASLLEKLQEDQWKNLPLQERLSLIQLVCNIESSYNGIGRVTVTAARLENTMEGKQNSGTKQIFINAETCMQEEAGQVITSVLHEWFHCYQDYILEGIDFETEAAQNARFFQVMRAWKCEKENYKDKDAYGYAAYYNQELEKSAREYAESEARLYLNLESKNAAVKVNETAVP
ncbi:hypothetical protein [Clostridium sp. AM58-1XD]|uniref:hypothetical protein n=1 Tax=Clostridium sp. AM58-1XD TaxID=2292307 RepID=UPI000E4BF023|nr:hypothetical protein [Clostridium sp. AM58-1XD]RGY99928.1 hypothetical protein DXA13_06900 [Clostridium sp. AM58-1XD]